MNVISTDEVRREYEKLSNARSKNIDEVDWVSLIVIVVVYASIRCNAITHDYEMETLVISFVIYSAHVEMSPNGILI